MGLSDIFEFIYDNTITDDPVLMENTKTMIDNINISSLLNIDKDISKQKSKVKKADSTITLKENN